MLELNVFENICKRSSNICYKFKNKFVIYKLRFVDSLCIWHAMISLSVFLNASCKVQLLANLTAFPG